MLSVDVLVQHSLLARWIGKKSASPKAEHRFFFGFVHGASPRTGLGIHFYTVSSIQARPTPGGGMVSGVSESVKGKAEKWYREH